jgi:hypothetical protein
MAVKVTLNKGTHTLEFRPETAEDGDVAEYLCRLVREAKAVVGSADPGTVAKSGIGGFALLRKEQDERIQVLKGIIDREDEKSRRWDLSSEIRQIAAQRAHAAREELHALQEGR